MGGIKSMSKQLKIFLIAASGFAGLLVLVAVALFIFVSTDAYRPRLEAAASGALGLEVRVDGPMGIDLFPALQITMENVHIGNQGAEVATVKKAKFGIELLPLFKKQIRFGMVELKNPRLSIERDRDGHFNFENPEAGSTIPALHLTKVSLADGTLRFTDKLSGEGFEALGCSLNLDPLQLSAGKRSNRLKLLSFTAELACKEVRRNAFAVSDLKLSAEGKNGVFNLKPVTMRVFGAEGSGSLRADFSGATPLYAVRYALPQFRIEEFFKILSPQKVAEGAMDFSANLAMQGKTAKQMRQTAKGQILLRGKNLVLIGRDLDRELSRIESSQNFDLVDVGAFFLAGPLGLAVTKGFDFAKIFQRSEGRSEIPRLVSDWNVAGGVAQAQDVAMATKENRIALQGGLDFINEQFIEVTMALIDAKGCAKVQQKIRGSFQEPVVEKPSILKSLTGSVFGLFEKGREILPGGECEVFYSGSVAQPE
jgi:AsmA protein